MSTATSTITAPVASWSRPLCPDSRRVSRRPPIIRTYSTTAVPTPYASATASRPAVNDCAADTVITPARIGPAHGAYTSPRLRPSTSPEPKPSPEPAGRRARAGTSLPSTASRRAPRGGISSVSPKPSSTTIASVRTRSSGSPSASIT